MTRALSRSEVRELDRRAIEEFGVPAVVLMENAGRGAAEVLLSLDVFGPVVVFCGKGNNGGDGFVIARHLDLRGQEVRVLLFGDPETLQGEARINYEIVARSGIPLTVYSTSSLDVEALQHDLDAAEWVVDALFGTGLEGPVRSPFDQVIQLINESQARVFAVDIPSGLDCDTGQPMGPTIQASHTATFVAMKQGFLAPDAGEWTGKVHVVGIGVPRALLEQFQK